MPFIIGSLPQKLYICFKANYVCSYYFMICLTRPNLLDKTLSIISFKMAHLQYGNQGCRLGVSEPLEFLMHQKIAYEE